VLHTYKSGALRLEPKLQSIFAMVILEMGSHDHLSGLALNRDSPDVSLPGI
jgi:hypothetical protein